MLQSRPSTAAVARQMSAQAKKRITVKVEPVQVVQKPAKKPRQPRKKVSKSDAQRLRRHDEKKKTKLSVDARERSLNAREAELAEVSKGETEAS